MGKKSQTKDRGYITAAEWQTEWGGHKDKSKRPFKSLPFNCCAITFTPFQDPVSFDKLTLNSIVLSPRSIVLMGAELA